MTGNRKRIRHYYEPGDLHELTFSCYRQLQLLTNDVGREMLCRSIDRAMESQAWRLVAFVLMPEHVHLLVYPTTAEVKVDRLLSAIKRPHSARIRRSLKKAKSPLLKRLTVQERPGKWAFRYWQEGPGYDRNLSTEAATMAAINYIHENPVRRGLVTRGVDWKWSSARWYVSDRQTVDPDLPTIHGLPQEFWTDSTAG